MTGDRLLLDDRVIALTPTLVRALDGKANEAIVLQQLHWWMRHATAEHDGHRWVWNSYEEWSTMTGLTPKQVRTAIGNLATRGLVIVYAPPSTDRTRWYRIDYSHKILRGVVRPEPPRPHGPLQAPKRADDSISTKRSTERRNPSTSVVPTADGEDPLSEWSPEVVALTREFAIHVRDNGFPLPAKGSKAATGWFREFDRLLRLGPPGDTGEAPPPTPDEIRHVMGYAMADLRDGSGFPGWAAVIRSAGKFREQFPRLSIEANRRQARSGASLAKGYADAAAALRSRT